MDNGKEVLGEIADLMGLRPCADPLCVYDRGLSRGVVSRSRVRVTRARGEQDSSNCGNDRWRSCFGPLTRFDDS